MPEGKLHGPSQPAVLLCGFGSLVHSRKMFACGHAANLPWQYFRVKVVRGSEHMEAFDKSSEPQYRFEGLSNTTSLFLKGTHLLNRWTGAGARPQPGRPVQA